MFSISSFDSENKPVPVQQHNDNHKQRLWEHNFCTGCCSLLLDLLVEHLDHLSLIDSSSSISDLIVYFSLSLTLRKKCKYLVPSFDDLNSIQFNSKLCAWEYSDDGADLGYGFGWQLSVPGDEAVACVCRLFGVRLQSLRHPLRQPIRQLGGSMLYFSFEDSYL